MKFFLIILLCFSCSYQNKDENNKNEIFLLTNAIISDDIKEIKKILNSKFKIKTCQDLRDILKFSYNNYNILKLLKDHNIPVKEGENLNSFNYNNNLKCNISELKKYIRDPKIYLDFDIHISIKELKDFFEKNNYLLINIYNKSLKKLIIKYKKIISKKDINDFVCMGIKTFNTLIYWEKIFNNIDYNWFENKNSRSRSIFYCFVNTYYSFYLDFFIDFSAIKYMIENGANWNIEQDNNLNQKEKGYTPFDKFLHWKGLTIETLQYAIKTGAKWNLKGKSYPFNTLIQHNSLTSEMIKYAIKTGAKWEKTEEFDPFKELLEHNSLTSEMIKYAIKTGAKWGKDNIHTHFEFLIERSLKNMTLTLDMVKTAIKSGAKIEDISEFRISLVKNKKIRDYLMKLKKESLKK